MKLFRKMALTVVPALALAMGPASVRAEVIQLGFILDSSGSIGTTNWGVITTGLKNAINTYIPVGGANTYEISVVSFASTAAINIDSFTVDSLAHRQDLATAIGNIVYQGGGIGNLTNFSAGFTAMNTALTNGIGTNGHVTPTTPGVKSYVNFATDGVSNTGGTNNAGEFATALSALINAGVDNISIEGIGGFVDANVLKTQVCYPTPVALGGCDATAPYNFPTQGFYIPVATSAAYADAISLKIQTVVQGNDLPEPSMLSILGLGLCMAAFSRRGRGVSV